LSGLFEHEAVRVIATTWYNHQQQPFTRMVFLLKDGTELHIDHDPTNVHLKREGLIE
jgi:hypothetical protein